MKPYSITRRLILTALFVELVAALCTTGVALVYERHVHFRSFDVLLRGRADSILGAVQDAEDAQDNVMLDGSELNVPTEDVYEVDDANGRIIGNSANWTGHTTLPVDGRHESNLFAGKSPSRDPTRPWEKDDAVFYSVVIHGDAYRLIRIQGLRVVDPGDKGGGVRRYLTIHYGSPVKRVWKAILRSVGLYALNSLIVLCVTGMLLFWLLRRGLAPLRELAAAAASVSVSSWSFAPPQRARLTQELAPLVTAIETALEGLEHSFDQQKRFVGDAAHELKTGVAVVKSSLQLLGMKPRQPAEYQAGLERCLADCLRMEELVAQMLLLARVEQAPSADPATIATDLNEAIEDVILQFATMAEARDVAIALVTEKTTPVSSTQNNAVSIIAQIDPEQFRLLCSNLLMNAIQHSPHGAVIQLRVSAPDRLAHLAQVEFEDQGDGIPAVDLPHIFERFSRSDPSRSRNTGGTGLGLAICKAIVDRAGGTIAAHSAPHSGTLVIVQLPLAPLHPGLRLPSHTEMHQKGA